MLRVLLAEDNPADRLLLEASFTAAGCKDVSIEAVTDGRTFLQRVASPETLCRQFDLIVLDAFLPDYTARELMDEASVRRAVAGVPLVVLSTLVSEKVRGEMLALGAREVLVKPMDLNDYRGLARRLAQMVDPSAC